jgi:large subunit ribosomal protein L9
MWVILRENVENLGQTGDVVKVSDGYARNFLLPRKLVVFADEKNKAAIEHHKRTLEKARLAQKAHAQELAARLEKVTCTISRKVGEQDKLFGSVTAVDVADALKALGYEVSKRDIRIEHPIKAVGTFPVVIRLAAEVEATIQLTVTAEA